MWGDDDLVEAVRDQPAAAALALASLPWNDKRPLTPDAIEAAARRFEEDAAEFWVERLRSRGLMTAFAQALIAQGVELDTGEQEPDWADHVDPQLASRFMLRASSFRCRIFRDGVYRGTGCLVGPGLVLTAWHVIAVNAPGQPQEPIPQITVTLADGSTHEAQLPAQYESPCSLDEWAEQVPRKDDDVAGGHDVVLLTLKTRAATHLGYVKLPVPVPAAKSNATVLLAHFPQGQDPGIGIGRTSKIRGVTARFLHNVETNPGSSGGACFNNKTQLLGIHQGVWDRTGVLIPLTSFAGDLAADIDSDLSPRQLWRLDESSMRLVVGRSLFVEAVGAAAQDGSRVRGVWVKRRDITASGVGLAYSFDILHALLRRRGINEILVRLPQDEIAADLFADIRQRVAEASLQLPPAVAPAGSDNTQAAPEAAARAVADLLALALNGAAQSFDKTVWFFIHNPSVPLSEGNRLALEAFVAAVLTQPRLRLVVTGLETVAFAGQQFAGPGMATGGGANGLVVEYMGTFRREDILDCLSQACEQILGEADPARVEDAANRALLPVLESRRNGVYDMSVLPEVIGEMSAFVEVLTAEAAGDLT